MTAEVLGFVGRYGDDIGVLTRDDAVLSVQPAAVAENPSYLAISSRGVVYAGLEGEKGAVGAFLPTGSALRPLGTNRTGGFGTCHVALDNSERFLVAADYVSGTLSVHKVEEDGSLGDRTCVVQHFGGGPNATRQGAPHAHMIVPEPGTENVIAVDLGTDNIFRYHLSEGGLKLSHTARVQSGAGPRHLVLHPASRFGYVANELDGTVGVLDLDRFELSSTVAVDTHPTPGLLSAIRLSADGRFCWVANRGPDTVTTLAVSPDGSSLERRGTVPSGGAHPRDLVVAGDAMYVANQHSDEIDFFRLDPESGQPRMDGPPVPTPAPTCVILL